MVVHFTIAINYLCSLVGIIGAFRRKDSFWGKSFFYLLILSILATIAAGAAGVISESYLTNYPSGVHPMFHQHTKYGELTGVLLVVSFVIQLYSLARQKQYRVTLLALVFCLAATVTVSIAGHLGGTMVYHFGLGVQ